MGQTVNLLAHAFGGSNPSLPTTTPVGVARSALDAKASNEERKAASERCIFAEVAQLIEQ